MEMPSAASTPIPTSSKASVVEVVDETCVLFERQRKFAHVKLHKNS
jgi:hypothetical protein